MILLGMLAYFGIAALLVFSMTWAASRPMPKPNSPN